MRGARPGAGRGQRLPPIPAAGRGPGCESGRAALPSPARDSQRITAAASVSLRWSGRRVAAEPRQGGTARGPGLLPSSSDGKTPPERLRGRARWDGAADGGGGCALRLRGARWGLPGTRASLLPPGPSFGSGHRGGGSGSRCRTPPFPAPCGPTQRRWLPRTRRWAVGFCDPGVVSVPAGCQPSPPRLSSPPVVGTVLGVLGAIDTNPPPRGGAEPSEGGEQHPQPLGGSCFRSGLL